MLTEKEVTNITNILALKTAIVFYLSYLILSYFCRKKALKRIKNNLNEGEYIIYEPKFSYATEIIFPLGIGGFLGGFILPFFIYKNIQYIQTSPLPIITRNSLPILITGELILIFAVCFISCWKYAVTNQRILTAYAFDFIYKLGNKITEKFSDISVEFSNINYLEIKNVKPLSLKLFNIWLKDGTCVKISPFENIEKVKSLIESYIRENK